MPHMADPAVNMINPNANIYFLPYRSESFPQTSSSTDIARRYDVTTHCIELIVTLNSFEMIGSAMFTILPSKVAMNIDTDTFKRISHFLRLVISLSTLSSE
jgi:hypothetical protein